MTLHISVYLIVFPKPLLMMIMLECLNNTRQCNVLRNICRSDLSPARSAVVENRLGNTVWTAVIHSTGTACNTLCSCVHLSNFHKGQFRDFWSNTVNLSVDECSCLLVPKYPCPAHKYPTTGNKEVVDGQL